MNRNIFCSRNGKHGTLPRRPPNRHRASAKLATKLRGKGYTRAKA